MQKGQVFAPLNIADQFTFEKFIMLKMFLSAAAASMLIQIAMALYDSEFFHKTRKENSITTWRIVLGGCTLGAGMYTAGSCPGNIYIQIGTNVEDVLYIAAGAVAGSLIYYVFDEVLCVPSYFDNTNKKVKSIENSDEKTKAVPKYATLLDEFFGVSYYALAIPLALVLAAVVAGLEYFFPFNSELSAANQYDPNSLNVFTQKSWPPWVAGVLVGCLQLPARLSNNKGLGSATSTYAAVSSLLGACGLEAKVTFAQNQMALLQFLYMVCGAVPGALTAALLSGQFGDRALVPGVGPVRGFAGGLLLLFGARLANGCTSGHGLTGFSNLSLQSVLNTCCMFGSAIVTGMTAKYLLH
eukprot:Mrub_04404.p1 GENE.Mrub_04404~~Mrub_04404.p1  ORF type:complete len:373 (-),score=154.65 Mrub_04404:159-1223(-)